MSRRSRNGTRPDADHSSGSPRSSRSASHSWGASRDGRSTHDDRVRDLAVLDPAPVIDRNMRPEHRTGDDGGPSDDDRSSRRTLSVGSPHLPRQQPHRPRAWRESTDPSIHRPWSSSMIRFASSRSSTFPVSFHRTGDLLGPDRVTKICEKLNRVGDLQLSLSMKAVWDLAAAKISGAEKHDPQTTR